MSFLGLEGKTFLITGVSNKKSIAHFVSKTLLEEGADIVLTVQSEEHYQRVEKLYPNKKIFIVDVEDQKSLENLSLNLKEKNIILHGLLHSMAYANYSEGLKPFHETNFNDFSQAVNISCFSLGNICNNLKDSFDSTASVVTISISNTKVTTYGYMGPIKSMLETSVSYLAKSFSNFSTIRFNSVCAGPLKTSASAGIPNYIENYLYAEELTLRKKALQTQEVANTICFLLSERSSGINASQIMVDAGMNCNYFDENIVKKFHQNF